MSTVLFYTRQTNLNLRGHAILGFLFRRRCLSRDDSATFQLNIPQDLFPPKIESTEQIKQSE